MLNYERGIEDMLNDLEDHQDRFSDWENDFYQHVYDMPPDELTDKQRRVIINMWEKYC
jgi:hypothetical protein